MTDRPINERLILSLYDATGNWAQPYIKAGYPVMLWDKSVEGDIMDFNAVEAWLSGYYDFVYGILAAPPCDHFAASGARWWKDKDEETIDMAIALAEMVNVLRQQCDNVVFWALENPVGRIEKLCPWLKPYRKLSFDPCQYGETYTKKTILWGEFNAALPQTPVLALDGSKMHNMSSSAKAKRSATPMGFANAFFKANQ